MARQRKVWDNLRFCYLSSQVLVEPIQALQDLQSSDSTSIFNSITEESSQNLDLLSREVLRRKGRDNGCQVGDSLSAQDRVLVVDIFPKRLHGINQGGFLGFDIYSHFV